MNSLGQAPFFCIKSAFCLCSGHNTCALEVPALVLQAVRLGLELELEPEEAMARIWPSYLLLRLLALQQFFLRQPCASNAEHLAHELGHHRGILVRVRSIGRYKIQKSSSDHFRKLYLVLRFRSMSMWIGRVVLGQVILRE
jgi:hypothetical protein